MAKGIVLIMVSLGLAWAVATAGAQETSELFRQGEAVYMDNCAACHRSNGEGLPNVFPALKASPPVTGDPAPVVRVILDGRKGKIGRMPAWRDILSDQQIAGVATYIRQHWGNQAEAVSPEAVAKHRKK